MASQRSPTDPTDDERRALEPLRPPARPGGRPRRVGAREVANAVRYLLRSGCPWRPPPRGFPPWPTV